MRKTQKGWMPSVIVYEMVFYELVLAFLVDWQSWTDGGSCSSVSTLPYDA